MVFNATFNNISAILWRSVLLVEKTGIPGENHRPAASHLHTSSHNVVLSTPLLSGVRTHSLIMHHCVNKYKNKTFLLRLLCCYIFSNVVKDIEMVQGSTVLLNYSLSISEH